MINARGPDQFPSPAGRRTFLYTYFTWVSSGLKRSNILLSSETVTAMPEIAVVPHMALAFIPLSLQA
jgi:hypothetical protein